MKCKICGTRLKDGTTQCPTCGAIVGNEESTANTANLGALKRTTCPTCGKEVIGEHRRCPFCKDYLMCNDFGDVAKQAASVQQTASASVRKIPCAGCGYEVDENNMPSDWKNVDGKHYCPYCYPKVPKPQPATTKPTPKPQQAQKAQPQQATTVQSQPAAASPQTAQSNAKPKSAAKAKSATASARKIPCAGCGYEVYENKIPRSGWKNVNGVYYCPFCYQRVQDIQGKYGQKLTREIAEHFCWECRKDPARVTEFTIPPGYTDFGRSVFYGFKNLQSVTIPDSATKIGEYAFSECKKLQSVTIPDSVTEIGSCAFKICKNLKTVTIPKSVMKINDKAFCYCSNLSTIIMESSTPPIYGEDAFANNAPGRKVIVPKGSLAAYKNAPGWKNVSNLCEE